MSDGLDLPDGRDITKRNKRRVQRNADDLVTVLSTPPGRRFVWRLLSECGVFHGSFNESSNRMAFQEGRRDIGLMILNEVITEVPSALDVMRREHESDLKSTQPKKEGKENDNGE